MTSPAKKFARKSAADILRLLKDKQINNYSTSAFCKQHSISHQTFYNWQKKYGTLPSCADDFIALPIANMENLHRAPFCEIIVSGKTTLRFFNAVDARYLKSIIY